MIRQAFQHLPGIGPQRLKQIEQLGISDWSELVQRGEELALDPGTRRKVASAVEACERAAADPDMAYLVGALAPRDQWRILATYFDRAAYFDIETAGLDEASPVTLISCYAQGNLHTFVRNENLDGFLDLLEDVELLVSFNGASFDVPKVLREFHIPSLPCAHLDLRWVCYHTQRRGGLKSIERQLGLRRPPELDGMTGNDAVWLWRLWDTDRNRDARDRLIRYGCADALTLEQVAARLLTTDHGVSALPMTPDPWGLLTQFVIPPATASPTLAVGPPANPLTRRLEQHWQRRKRGAADRLGG